jgi:hypothetical protein
MKTKKAQGLPTEVIIVVVIALVVLALVLVFYSVATGRYIFPELIDKIKNILGLWNSTKVPGS